MSRNYAEVWLTADDIAASLALLRTMHVAISAEGYEYTDSGMQDAITRVIAKLEIAADELGVDHE